MSTDIPALLNERGSLYGEFVDNSVTMQALKDIMRAAPNWKKLKPHQREALDMVAHKAGRILHGDPEYRDSWDDIIGYVTRVTERMPP